MRVMKTDDSTLAGMLTRTARNESTGCLEWTGGTTGPWKYAVYFIKSKPKLAHRRAFQLANPNIDISAMFICHHCDNPRCINPGHLFAGTQSENIMDCVRKGRHPRKSAKGSKKPDAKLTEDQIPRIRERIAAGEPCTKIAKDYGVSHTIIYSVKNGHLWRHA